MKINIYELLGMLKDGNAPKKIKYRQNIFKFIHGLGDYKPDDIAKYHGNYLLHYLFEEEVNFLNDTLEILEEENENGTIGFPNGQWTARNMDKAFAMKINSIIDYLKSKGE